MFMARKPRIHFPGAFYHCINRGNQCKQLFFSDEDYLFMLDRMAYCTEKFGALIHAFCLMPNHFHLLLQVQDIPLSSIMRSALTSFAKYFNRLHRKVGHVFQGRYRAILCQKETYLMELVRYIHLNPVRAHLANSPQQWRWCSLASYLHLSQHSFLYTQDILACFGQRPRLNLLDFLSQAPALASSLIYPPESFPLLGDDAFAKRATEPVQLRRQLPRSFPGPRLSLATIAKVCSEQSHLPMRLLDNPHKGCSDLHYLRQIIAFAATHYFFYKPSQLAQFFHVAPSSVSRMNFDFRVKILKQPVLEMQLFQPFIKR
jgi:REP element-mobilizing transposase RayT